jgi:hypothetical protein
VRGITLVVEQLLTSQEGISSEEFDSKMLDCDMLLVSLRHQYIRLLVPLVLRVLAGFPSELI